jgi:hypothetical protein
MATLRRSGVVPIRPAPEIATISRSTPFDELPHLLAADELRALLGLGKDAAYKLLTERGVIIGRRRFLPRRVIEEMVRGE